MRLYLSSYRLGDHAERLVELSRNGPIAIVGNALDFIPDDARRKYEVEVYDPRREFSDLGLDADDVDLRRYFGNPAKLADTLRKFALVWLIGGNAFLLMRAISQSGFGTVIRALLERDEIAFGGFSAGAVVAGPTLRGIDLIDDSSQLADGYEPQIIWDGLGLVDFTVIPHYRSDHPESHLADRAVAFMESNRLPFKAMADGDVFVLEGGHGRLLQRK